MEPQKLRKIQFRCLIKCGLGPSFSNKNCVASNEP